MKVFPLTTEQQATEKTLTAAIKATSEPFQAAHKAYRAFVLSVTKGEAYQRSQVADDGVNLVIQ